MKTKILIALMLFWMSGFTQTTLLKTDTLMPTLMTNDRVVYNYALYSFNTNDSSLYTQEYLDYCNQPVKDTVIQEGKIYKYISYDKPNDTTWNKLEYSEWKDDFTVHFLVGWGGSILWNTQFHFSGVVIELKEIKDRYYWAVVEDINNPVEIWIKREKPSTYGFYEFKRKWKQKLRKQYNLDSIATQITNDLNKVKWREN